MAERVQREQWEHTSTVLCMIANVNRDPKKGRAYKPRDFNPFYASEGGGRVPIRKNTIQMLKAFVRGRKGG